MSREPKREARRRGAEQRLGSGARQRDGDVGGVRVDRHGRRLGARARRVEPQAQLARLTVDERGRGGAVCALARQALEVAGVARDGHRVEVHRLGAGVRDRRRLGGASRLRRCRCEPKASVSGERPSAVWMPVPVSVTARSAALDAIVTRRRLARRCVVGSNRARTVAGLPGGEDGAWRRSPSPARRSGARSGAASPVTVTEVKVTVSLPVLVTVEVCVAVGPSSTSREPNVSVVGLRSSSV